MLQTQLGRERGHRHVAGQEWQACPPLARPSGRRARRGRTGSRCRRHRGRGLDLHDIYILAIYLLEQLALELDPGHHSGSPLGQRWAARDRAPPARRCRR
jgi:hypothetical protein